MSAQAMQALAYANEVRATQTEIRLAIRAGERTVADALDEPALANKSIGWLLGAQWRWGPHRVRRFLSPLAVSPARMVGNLTERQRRGILAALEAR